MTEEFKFHNGVKIYFRYFSHNVLIVECMLQSGPLEFQELHRILAPTCTAQEIRIGLLQMKHRGIVKHQPGVKKYDRCKWYVPDGLQHQLSAYLWKKYAAELSSLIPSGTCPGIRIQG